jgi:hypothetical protein
VVIDLERVTDANGFPRIAAQFLHAVLVEDDGVRHAQIKEVAADEIFRRPDERGGVNADELDELE